MNELSETIESHRFSAFVNVASDFDHFLQSLASMPETRGLLIHLTAPSARRIVLERLRAVTVRDIDPEYENPWDVALATYLWVLWTTDASLAALGREHVLSSRNCWWSRKLAESLSQAIPSTSAHACTTYYNKASMVDVCNSHSARTTRKVLVGQPSMPDRSDTEERKITVKVIKDSPKRVQQPILRRA
ncbi:MAG: hypothetical protein ACHRXM_09340 [Isosphaerales bacterium]